jgi:hypothetical protein
MNTNFHIVKKVCLLYWQNKISGQHSDDYRPALEIRNTRLIINLSFPITHKMDLAIMKDYTVNAITKTNILNKVNDDVYDMFTSIPNCMRLPSIFHCLSLTKFKN